MSFDLEVARRIVKEMRATDWLKYEDEFEMLTWFPDALTEIETLRIQLDAAHRLIKEQAEDPSPLGEGMNAVRSSVIR